MARRVPDQALRTLRGQPPNQDRAGGRYDAIDEQKKKVLRETNPDFVAPSTRLIDVFSPEARLRRAAVRTALEARLAIFRDNIEAIRTANRVMNNAAIVQVMIAAENFIVQIRSDAEMEKANILDSAQNQLLEQLGDHLDDLERIRQRGTVPEELVDVRFENAMNDYATRCIKIAGLDFEFDKTKLLNLG